MKISKIKQNLEIDEKVNQKILNELETISDPSNLLMSIFHTVIDYISIANTERALFWENTFHDLLIKYKDKNSVENEVMGLEHTYVYPFMFSLKNSEPDFLKLKMFLKEYKEWAEGYYSHKISKEVNEKLILCSIILKIKIEYSGEITPLAKNYIKFIDSENDEKIRSELKTKIKQRMKNEGGLHFYSILYLMAYYTLCGKTFTLNDYIEELFENGFLERD